MNNNDLTNQAIVEIAGDLADQSFTDKEFEVLRFEYECAEAHIFPFNTKNGEQYIRCVALWVTGQTETVPDIKEWSRLAKANFVADQMRGVVFEQVYQNLATD